MPVLDKKEAFLEALKNVTKRKKEERVAKSFSPADGSMNLAKGQLDQDILRAKSAGGTSADITEPVTKMRGTDVIDSGPKQPIISGDDFAQKQKNIGLKGDLKKTFKAAAQAGDTATMSKLRKIAKGLGRGVKSLPVIGTIAALAGAEDASAAIPILDMAEPTGPRTGSLGAKLEAGTITPEERQELKRQMLTNMVKSRTQR